MSNVAVVGLGYVGLPLAVQAAEKGHSVLGIDLNAKLIDLVNERKSPYVNDTRFEQAISRIGSDQLEATTSYDQITDADVIILCVPTPTENNIPDISLVTKAASQVAQHMRKGQLIVLESTVNPGVTRDEVLPILEKVSGLIVGEDFYLAHCPERIDPGNHELFVGNLNRVVGGITKACTDRAVSFYTDIIDAKIVPLASTEEAEFVKSWENSHRNVMIALANSAALICDAVGMNIENVLEGLQSKVDQFGLKLAKPGLGPGGHCIPEDIHYVIRKARQNNIDTSFLDGAVNLNDRMPRYAVHKLQEMISRDGEKLSEKSVALLGLGYKENIGDYRRSPAIEVGHHLARYAKEVVVYDPYVDTNSVKPIKGAKYVHNIDEALSSCDAVFLGTGHDQFRTALLPDNLETHNIKYFLDGRNLFKASEFRESTVCYGGIGQ